MTDPKTSQIESILEPERLYSSLLDQSNDLIHCISSEGRFLYVNKAWRETLGYTEEEIRTLTPMDVIEEGHQKKCQRIFEALIKGEQPNNNVTVFLARDGKQITVEGRFQSIFEKGQVVAITGIFKDISDRIQKNIALRESENRFRTLFENSLEIMQIVAPNGHFFHVNPAWMNAFGYNQDEVKRMSIFDLIAPDCQSHCIDTFQEVLSTPGVHEIDTIFVAKNGSRVEIEGTATAIFQDERPQYTQCIFRDVTIKRKMEKEFLKAKKLESIGVFAGGLAHDFNNLLTAILGNISLAIENLPPNTPLGERLQNVETATIRAKGLTQQLLTFAKGGEPIKKLSGVADVVRQSVDFHLHGSNVKREYNFVSDLWTAEVDEDQLSQVVQNLVINAVQAMPDGGCLTVTGENITLPANHKTQLKPGHYLLLTVSDEGHGISSQDQEKIFDPYFSNKEQGSGLGLAVAYTIMKKHDGLLTVDSAPGQRTTFSLYLPAASNKIKMSEEAPQKEQRSGGKILIMDDEESIREIAGEMLQFLGYTTSSAADGEQALSMYQEAMAAGDPYDAVLMDLTIPGGMGGREAMTRLLEIDPQAYGIASSGYANDAIMANFKDYGFSGVVPKPYKLDELKSSLPQPSELPQTSSS